LSGDETYLIGDHLTGFQPLVSRDGAGGGNRGESLAEAMAARLSETARLAGAQFKSLWFCAGMGGTAYSGLEQGTIPYANMLTAISRAKTLAEELGMRVVVDAAILAHGEADANNTNYESELLTWQSNIETDVKSITGQIADIPFFMNQPSSFYSASEATRAMQRIASSSAKHFLLGPNYPFEFASDVLHLSGPGYFQASETASKVLRDYLWSASPPDCLHITEAARASTTVTLTYHVPDGPLTFDTTQVNSQTNHGFVFKDSDGEVAINSVSITHSGIDGIGRVVIELANEPSGVDEMVEYALVGHSGSRTVATIPRGNLRDSAGDNNVSRYNSRRLDNWAVHQRVEL
jgi:hypothetical protein